MMKMFADGLMKGEKILVTGGGTGLGKSMATAFAALGAVDARALEEEDRRRAVLT